MTNKNIILLDLFSGTGGFHKGLSDAGFDLSETYYSEIDKHAIANYKYNFPNAKYIGSVENILQSGIARPNIITFGSPCQDFSLAGKRAGMAGYRSSLIQKAIAGITHFRPNIFIWENVKGTFSSNVGADFWGIIQAFANIGGYRLEWQLVNTSWILPQNRERIYLVGHLATSFPNWRSVFPIQETDCDFNGFAKSGQTSETIRTIMAGYGKIPTDGQYIEVVQINPSTESNGKQPFQHNRIYDAEGISPTLNTDARPPMVLGVQQTLSISQQMVIQAVISPLRSSSSKQGGRLIKNEGEPSFTLTSQNVQGVVDDNKIRRLTEIECERLQGYTDNWTQFGKYDGITKEVPRTQRYKLLGNAVTKTMVETIGVRILKNYS